MSVAARVTSAGIVAPTLEDIVAEMKAQIRGIYGSDIYLESDSQDGQMINIFATAAKDLNDLAVGVHNAFSPATAQGIGLSNVVKINGLRRLTSSNSTADVLCVGQTGTPIGGLIIGDNQGLGTRWALAGAVPADVVIPDAGQIVVTATCTQQGAVPAEPNTLTAILTPVRGWQTVNNAAAAVPGAPVETDASLRQRQNVSTALPALTPLDSIIAGVANVEGVGRYTAYQNDTGTTDANGLPAHSVSVVVEGGDALQVATVISAKKSIGTATYGTTSETVVDANGIPNVINFFRLTEKRIIATITGTALDGYVSTTDDLIKAAVAEYINTLVIGGDVLYQKLYGPANLLDAPLNVTFNITDIQIALYGNPVAPADIAIAFNEAASCAAADIDLTIA